MPTISISVDLDCDDGEVAFTARGTARRPDEVTVSLLSVSKTLPELKRDIEKQAAQHFPESKIELYLSEKARRYADSEHSQDQEGLAI